jgi:hypothetical protein
MAMAPRIGYLRDLFTKFSDLKLSAEHLPSSKDSVSITTGISSDPKEAALQHKAIEQFIHTARQHLLTRSGSVEVVDQAVVYAVGEALRDPRIRTFAARDLQDCAIEAGVNIESVGNRKVPSLAFLVERDHVEPFAMKIHERLIAA